MKIKVTCDGVKMVKGIDRKETQPNRWEFTFTQRGGDFYIRRSSMFDDLSIEHGDMNAFVPGRTYELEIR